MDLVKDLEEVHKDQNLIKINTEIEKLTQQYSNDIKMDQIDKRKMLKQRLRMKQNQLHMKRMSKSAQMHKLEKMERKMEEQDVDISKNKKSLFSKNNLNHLEDSVCEDNIDHLYQEILENE